MGFEGVEEMQASRRGYTVLVVEPDPLMRERLARWIGDAHLEVLRCPGPHAPEYTCPAGFVVHCPLASAADVIVLDLWLESDTVLFGTPAAQVLLYYLSLNTPVVALTDGTDPLVPAPQEGVEILRRPPDRRSLIEGVRRLLPVGPPPEPGRVASVPDEVGGRPMVTST